jgi:hypothetical protein
VVWRRTGVLPGGLAGPAGRLRLDLPPGPAGRGWVRELGAWGRRAA